jgi:SHS2 domain-containing protein
VIVEAWGPDLAACCEEAVAGLVAVYAEAASGGGHDRRRVHVEPAPSDVQLLDLLEEVIFTLDTAVGVPVAAEVVAASDGGLDVTLLLAAGATGTGAVPKAISRSGLRVDEAGGRVRCRFLVDV